jgi:phosphatidylglycerophosphatase A
MATPKADVDALRRREPPHHDTIVIVGMLGAIILAALAVIFRSPGYILAPQRFETAYYWPFATFRVYYDVLIVGLILSAALCIVTCLGSMFALSSKRRSVDGGALPYDRMYALVGISFAAFVSSTYLIIAPFNVGVGLAASAAMAIIFWLVLREDGKSRNLE